MSLARLKGVLLSPSPFLARVCLLGLEAEYTVKTDKIMPTKLETTALPFLPSLLPSPPPAPSVELKVSPYVSSSTLHPGVLH